MAKIILVVAFCLLNVVISKAAFNKEEAIKDFMIRVEECRVEVGAASSDVEDLVKKAPAASKEGKCLRSCMMKKYDVMDGNGKFVKSVALEHASTVTDGDEGKMQTANEIVDACAGIEVPDDHCEAAAIYGKCFMDQAKAHGLDKFEF